MTIGIRAATAADAEVIAAIYAPYVVSSGVSVDSEPPSVDEMRRRMGESDGLYPWLVAIDDDSAAVLGYAYATSFRARHSYRFVVETAIFMAGEPQGKGVRRLLYGALIATLKAQSFTQAISGIALPNDAAITLHEQVGFRRSGVYREVGYKNGQWIDVGFWQCELTEPHEPPEEPESFATVGLQRG